MVIDSRQYLEHRHEVALGKELMHGARFAFLLCWGMLTAKPCFWNLIWGFSPSRMWAFVVRYCWYAQVPVGQETSGTAVHLRVALSTLACPKLTFFETVRRTKKTAHEVHVRSVKQGSCTLLLRSRIPRTFRLPDQRIHGSQSLLTNRNLGGCCGGGYGLELESDGCGAGGAENTARKDAEAEGGQHGEKDGREQ